MVQLSFDRASSSEPASSTSTSSSDDAHKNEGFLKSIFHRMTGQHDQLDPKSQEKEAEPKGQPNSEEEPKKAAGSG